LMAELEDALEALAAEQARRHAAGRDPAHDECPRVRRLSLPFLPPAMKENRDSKRAISSAAAGLEVPGSARRPRGPRCDRILERTRY
jgi:hypothetical protein